MTKGEKISRTYQLHKDECAVTLYNRHGLDIEKHIQSGYTINDLTKAGYGSYKLIDFYIKKYGYSDIIKINNIGKLRQTAITNGKKAANTLAGVELKPLTDEIIEWYKDSVAAGKYRMDILNELKEKFGYKRVKYNQLVKLYGIGDKNPLTGKLNPFYNHSPSYKCGRGIKSHILVDGKFIVCRSLLELVIFLYLKKNNIKFELSKHRIKYKNKKGVSRTYNPDIVLISDNSIVEIKPESLINIEINKLKFEAARKYCKTYNLKFDIITEHTFNTCDITFDYINDNINNGVIRMDGENYKRLLNNKDEYTQKNTNIGS